MAQMYADILGRMDRPKEMFPICVYLRNLR
jgi:hypothetical protein